MKAKSILLRYANVLLLAGIFLVAVVFAENFLSVRNIMNIIRQISILGLLTLGMTFVILVGQMDLSAGAVMTLAGLIAISFQGFMPPGLAILFALLVGLAAGLMNGLIMAVTKANSGESLMITLGTQMVLSAICLLYTGGFSLDGSKSEFYNAIGTGLVGSLPIPVIIFAAAVAVLAVIQSRTAFGRKVKMIGYNREAAQLAGIHNNRVKVICYMISGLMAAIAAVVLTARTMGASPTAGDGYEMDAIIAIVLGGTSLAGGAGSIVKTMIGLLTLGVLSNMMNLLGFGAFDQMIVKGCVLILAVAVDVWRRKQIVKA